MMTRPLTTTAFIFSLLFGQSDAFLKSRLKQMAISRAVQTTVTEAIALNVFDQTSLIREVSCNCGNHINMIIYSTGFVVFGYITLRRDRIDNMKFYKDSKRVIRILVLFLLIIFNKDVEYAY